MQAAARRTRASVPAVVTLWPDARAKENA